MSLVPFLNKHYTDGHRFQQDNDPKHTSRYAQWWIAENNINWFKTPASNPDLNPIELIWHTLKEYLRTVYKPKNLTDLKTGIKTFWSTVTPEECCKYINHLKKVIPKVIEVYTRRTYRILSSTVIHACTCTCAVILFVFALKFCHFDMYLCLHFVKICLHTKKS